MSGLKFLYNLILKDVVKGSGQASGIMSIGKDIRKLADKKFQRYVTSAQKQGVDLDKLSEQELKYTLELNKPKGQKIISADSPEGKGITEMLLGKRGKVIKADFGKPFAEEIVTVERVVTDIKKLEPIEAMKEANRVLKGEGRYKSLSKADREKIAMDESVTDHIFEREIKPDPEDMADGGRTGLSYLLAEDTNERVPFGAGGIDKVRRLFLQAIGAGAAGIGAVKSGLLGLGGRGTTKKVAQQVVKTPNAPGKPEWFDALITRVINEGDDVTKKFATKEREIVHLKKIDEDATVRVHRNLDDGTVRVDIDDPTTNVADEQGNAIVSMEVKGGRLEEGVKGKTPAEFEAVETDYGNFMDGPDDFITEAVENTVSDTKDLTADLTKVKMYAKNQKKPTIKEMMIQRERARDLKLAEENPAEYASGRQPDIDYSDYDDYA